MKINNRVINGIISESINKVLREGFDEIEDVPTFDVFNNDTSLAQMRSILESYVYDKNDNCVGRLCDLHFKYDTNSNHMLGTNYI